MPTQARHALQLIQRYLLQTLTKTGLHPAVLAPVAEHVAQELWSSVRKPPSSSKLAQRLIATRLTQRNKRDVKGSDVPVVKHLKPEHFCSGCGKPINAERNQCASCALEGAPNVLRMLRESVV